MLKKFIANWQYGIKARVVDGALVAKIDTAVQPTTVRISLDKIVAATLVTQSVGTDYDVFFLQTGGNIPVAKFEGREAAEVARCNIACALYRGTRPCRIKNAFMTTVGIVLALLVFAGAAELAFGGKDVMSTPSLGAGSMPAELSHIQPSAPAPASQGEPMSADDFLKE